MADFARPGAEAGGDYLTMRLIEHIDQEDPSVEFMTADRRWATVPDRCASLDQLDAKGLTVLQSEQTPAMRTAALVRCPN
jgi:hypothetical protein